jgi:HK97 family phage prohead protease
MKKEIKSLPFEVKEISEDSEYFTFEGYASTFGNIDLGDDIIVRGAFSKTLKKNAEVPVLWQHQMSEPVGKSIRLNEDDKGLYIKAILPKSDTLVSGRIIPQMKVGSIREMSIGFFTRESDMEKGVRLLKEIELFEVSLVTKAMNPQALVSGFKSVESLKDIEQSLKEMGLSNTEAKTLISKVKEFSNQRDAEEKNKEETQRDAEMKQQIIDDLNKYIINLKIK